MRNLRAGGINSALRLIQLLGIAEEHDTGCCLGNCKDMPKLWFMKSNSEIDCGHSYSGIEGYSLPRKA